MKLERNSHTPKRKIRNVLAIVFLTTTLVWGQIPLGALANIDAPSESFSSLNGTEQFERASAYPEDSLRMLNEDQNESGENVGETVAPNKNGEDVTGSTGAETLNVGDASTDAPGSTRPGGKDSSAKDFGPSDSSDEGSGLNNATSEDTGVKDSVDETVSSEDSLALQSEEDEPDPRASIGGTSGSCPWNLNLDTGVLTIGAGTLASSTSSAGWGWHNYRALINSVTFSGTVYTNTEAVGMFHAMTKLTTINNLEKLNTSAATNMQNMFSTCTNLKTLNLSTFDTTNVTSMQNMFNSSGFTSLNLSSFNTENVTNMAAMFYLCSDLTSLNLSSFSTPKLTSMFAMFEGCSSLVNLDASSLNTGSVTGMDRVFYGCSSLATLDISGFSTQSVTGINALFSGCSSLIQVKLGANFAFISSGSYLPSPTGNSPSGVPYTGNWKALSDGTIYMPSAIPSNHADTYDADFSTPTMTIVGTLTPGETLTATLENGGGLSYSYWWLRGDSADGPFSLISGATAATYTLTDQDLHKYIQCIVAYNSSLVAQATVGPVHSPMPVIPILNSATLISDGSIVLEYTTNASASIPYSMIVVYYLTDTGSWLYFDEIEAASTTVEDKSLTIDFSDVFEVDVSSEIYFSLSAMNDSGESMWSDPVELEESPQISVTVPTTMTGVVAADGSISSVPQTIINNGTLNMKIYDIAMTKMHPDYPLSDWTCYQSTDMENPLWQGSSVSALEVGSSPLIVPNGTVSLIWQGVMTNTDGIVLSATPVEYGSIMYTVGFSAS